jgi:hypothetical protein
MLLSLLGCRTSRRQARALFRLPNRCPDYNGTDLDAIAAVLTGVGLRCVRWEFLKRYNFRWVLAQVLKKSAHPLPTLIWFGAVHQDMKTRAAHIAVISGADAQEIRLLDPLGVAPPSSRRSNAALSSRSLKARLLPIRGVNYYLDARAGVGILRFQLPLC